ncbi:MAG TPA: hypothetical protein PK771_02010 [Spirochaetota bacterium]|nr:hypothetical protein [Spirochaetota bacterium]
MINNFEKCIKFIVPLTIIFLLAAFLFSRCCNETIEKTKNIKERKEKFDETNKNLNDSTIDALFNNSLIVPKQ